jgi:hypothetical protein
MTFTNLTPHSITIRSATGDITVPASGTVARVATSTAETRLLGGIPVQISVTGEVTGLPAQDGSIFIVSGMVMEALKIRGVTRPDVVAPATGPQDGAIRNDSGHIVAVTRLNGLV